MGIPREEKPPKVRAQMLRARNGEKLAAGDSRKAGIGEEWSLKGKGGTTRHSGVRTVRNVVCLVSDMLAKFKEGTLVPQKPPLPDERVNQSRFDVDTTD